MRGFRSFFFFFNLLAVSFSIRRRWLFVCWLFYIWIAWTNTWQFFFSLSTSSSSSSSFALMWYHNAINNDFIWIQFGVGWGVGKQPLIRYIRGIFINYYYNSYIERKYTIKIQRFKHVEGKTHRKLLIILFDKWGGEEEGGGMSTYTPQIPMNTQTKTRKK